MPTIKSELLAILPHEPQRERLGRLYASASTTNLIPRTTLFRAIRTHGRRLASAIRNAPFETLHSHDGTLFQIRTDAALTKTVIRLDCEL